MLHTCECYHETNTQSNMQIDVQTDIQSRFRTYPPTIRNVQISLAIVLCGAACFVYIAHA